VISSAAQIFIRDCKGCKCIIACQQYRARNCEDCDTLLFASTAPVVETSTNMRFGCFRFFYFNLAQQFKSVKMSVYDNKWSEVYDFTPKDGNWSFLPLDTKVVSLPSRCALQRHHVDQRGVDPLTAH
jgi:protein XRP2